MILIIDNYDSFTWNLVQRLGEIDPTFEAGRDLLVVRNDQISPAEADALDGGRGPSHVIVSPGPCTPKEAGRSPELIAHFAGRVPVLGVCLGHQCMADLHGMVVEQHPVLMHGKTSMVEHDGRGLFAGLSNPVQAMRYHSLVVRPESVPSEPDRNGNGWEVSATSTETHDAAGNGGLRVVMGLRRVWADPSKAPVEGVQFHPESFMTPEGPAMLRNFLKMGERARDLVHPAGVGEG